MAQLTTEEIEAIAVEAAAIVAKQTAKAEMADPKTLNTLVSEAVRQTLLQMGVDASNPIEMQRDFQHLREWRLASNQLRSRGILAILLIFISGLAGLLTLGLKAWFAH